MILWFVRPVCLTNVDAASELRLTGDYDVVAGRWARLTVQRFDPVGSKVTTGSLSVDLNSTSTSRTKRFSEVPGGYGVSSIVIPDGSGDVMFYYYDTLAGVWTITVSANGFATSSKKLFVKRDAIDHFDVRLSSTTVQAGDSQDVSVTAQDAFGNVVDDYVGRIHFASNARASPTGALPVLPNDYRFLLSDEGRKAWRSGIIFSAAQTNVFLNVSDVTRPDVTGSVGGISVLPGSATNMEYVLGPQKPELVGCSVQFAVKITDLHGNPSQGHRVVWSQQRGPERGLLKGLPRTVETDKRGLSYLSLALGNVPGDYSILASANTTEGLELLGSPVRFDVKTTSNPDFSIVLVGGEESWVQVGGSASIVIRVDSWGGYSSIVALRLSGKPGFLRANFSRDSGQPPYSSYLNIFVDPIVEQGYYNLTILAIGGDGRTVKETVLRLRVAHPTSYYAIYAFLGFTFAILSLIPEKLGFQKVWGMITSVVGSGATSLTFFSNVASLLMMFSLWITYILTMFSIYVMPGPLRTLISRVKAHRKYDKRHLNSRSPQTRV